MFRRLFAFILLAWALGFAWFALFLPQPAQDGRTDGVVVLTGGSGRIEHGLTVLRDGEAKAMLVSGVDREVRPEELAQTYDIDDDLFRCCVTLGYDSVDTRSNAQEVADWAAKNGYTSLRLVTSDWHMRRAAYHLERQLGRDVRVTQDAVADEPSLFMLFLEYHKYLAGHVATWIGF